MEASVVYGDWLVGTPCNSVDYGGGCTAAETGYHFKQWKNNMACWWHTKNQAWSTTTSTNAYQLALHFGLDPNTQKNTWCSPFSSDPFTTNGGPTSWSPYGTGSSNIGSWGWCGGAPFASGGFVCFGGSAPSSDCVGSWSSYDACSSTCGGGVQTRTYTITSPANGGASCPASNGQVDKRACSEQACPVDCQASWSSWSDCSATCGGGHKTRVFNVRVPGANGGATCEAADGHKEDQICADIACPHSVCDGKWSGFTCCSQECGGGIQYRTYKPSDHDEGNCPDREELKCNTEPCAPCQGSWSEWTRCDAPQCNGVDPTAYGQKQRVYTVTREAEHSYFSEEHPDAILNHGDVCPFRNGEEESDSCNIDCPVDCKGDWVEGECSATCEGFRTYTYEIARHAANGGAKCEKSHGDTVTEPCGGECPKPPVVPVDCRGRFLEWTTCSQENSCNGGGQRHRTYVVDSLASGGGEECPHEGGYQESEACNADIPCPVDCAGHYTQWTDCDVTCGGGVQTREYVIDVAPENGGRACPPASEKQECMTWRCPAPCSGSFGPWSDCSATCDGGIMSATFKVQVVADEGGVPCEYRDGQTIEQACNSNLCPYADCVGDWSKWSSCSEACDVGVQERVYTISQPAVGRGQLCPFSDGQIEAQTCDNSHVCPVHCEGEWSTEWSDCSVTCEGGIQTLDFIPSVEPRNGGTPCPEPRTSVCNTFECVPVHCEGLWSGYSCCDKPCGGGQQVDTYHVIVPASSRGNNCPFRDGATRVNPCNAFQCPSCDAGWSHWSECSVSCDGGERQRSFLLPKELHDVPNDCPTSGTVASETCNNFVCPKDCVGEWTDWSECTKTCGTGVQTRVFKITSAAVGGGAECTADSFETQQCAANPCAAWEHAITIRGDLPTFAYHNDIWTSTSLYDLNGEIKTASFNRKTNKVRVVFIHGTSVSPADINPLNPTSSDNSVNFVDLDLADGTRSLQQVFASNNHVATHANPVLWRNLTPGGGGWQPYCNVQGFNVNLPAGPYPANARIGIIMNQENDCGSPDTSIGLGTRTWGGNDYSAGNFVGCCQTGSNSSKPKYAMVFVWAL